MSSPKSHSHVRFEQNSNAATAINATSSEKKSSFIVPLIERFREDVLRNLEQLLGGVMCPSNIMFLMSRFRLYASYSGPRICAKISKVGKPLRNVFKICPRGFSLVSTIQNMFAIF